LISFGFFFPQNEKSPNLKRPGMPHFIRNSNQRCLDYVLGSFLAASFIRQVFWLPDQSIVAPSHLQQTVAVSDACPRLQRRAHDGFAPSSLTPSAGNLIEKSSYMKMNALSNNENSI
jgi:hypothetical protein